MIIIVRTTVNSCLYNRTLSCIYRRLHARLSVESDLKRLLNTYNPITRIRSSRIATPIDTLDNWQQQKQYSVLRTLLSVLAKWLARKTPLRKPNRGKGIISIKPGRRARMIFLVYFIASLFYYVFLLSPASTWLIFLLLWRDIAYLCWKSR